MPADVHHETFESYFAMQTSFGSGAGITALPRRLHAAPRASHHHIVFAQKTKLGHCTLCRVVAAPENSNIIWVGHNDGSVYYTTNGMDADPTWTSADPSNMLPGGPDEPLKPRMCTRITIGQVDGGLPRKVYVTFSGFFPSPTDSRGNVWKTENDGQMWADKSVGLPSAPMYSLVISPFNPARLYVGTEVGVFASPDRGGTWSPGNRGPANVPVLELFWMGPKLVAATHGRGIFTIGPANH
jgi:hypothetical protein